MKTPLRNNIFLSTTVILFTSCARVGTPSGGPADNTPPVVVRCDPENGSVRFSRKSFDIHCDEFLQLKNPSTELIVSPPLKEKPEIILRGKSIKVKLPEELRPNTTYTFNFGEAITDLHEGNPLTGYEYVFSTGDHIDSFRISGTVTEAFTLETPKEKVFILLHENLDDSCFNRRIPDYVGRTDIHGYFRICNLKKDTFRLYALADVNSNLLFDQSTEKIAFDDSLLIIDERDYVATADTSATDTFAIARQKKLHGITSGDFADSTSLPKNRISREKKLMLFQQQPEPAQYLKDYSRPEANRLKIIFNEPLSQPLTVHLTDTAEATAKLFIEQNGSRDSFDLWMLDSALIRKEKIQMVLTYEKPDSNHQLVFVNDTLAFNFTFPKVMKQKKHRRDDTLTVRRNFLELWSNYPSGSEIELAAPFRLESKTPVHHFDSTKVILYKKNDTMFIPVPFTIQREKIESTDTFYHARRFILMHEWEENTQYKIVITPETFTDIYGLSNDTIIFFCRSKKLESYGALYFQTENIHKPLIVQLLSVAGQVLKEKHITKAEEVSFEYLKPGEYIIKMIEDENENRKWDTGSFREKRQPERVFFYPDVIKVRANWDVELTWTHPVR